MSEFEHESEAEGIARIKAEMLVDPDEYARRVWHTSRLYRNPRFLRSMLAAHEAEQSEDDRVPSLEEFEALMHRWPQQSR